MAGTPNFAKEQLKSIVERIERLEEEKATFTEDIREVYAEAKGNGFDTAVLRQVIKLRKQDAAERQEREALLDLYMHALGMLADTPLGQSAVERAARDPEVRKAFKKLGTPVALTEEEKAKGQQAAFVDKKGNRMSIGVKPGDRPASPAVEAARAAGIGEGV